MAKNVIHKRDVRKAGNIIRSILIWSGFGSAAVAGLLLFFTTGNERVCLALVIFALLCYGFALRDFDLDDDD